MASKNVEILIIGSGPAGMTAAIYAYRSNRQLVVLEKGTPGGKVNITNKIQNWPSIKEVTGPDLANMFVDQVNALGISIIYGDVITVKKEADGFHVATDDGDYLASSVIVASGTSEKKLGIPGEETFVGRGVSYCATCDAAFYRNQDVAVIGHSSQAVEEALALADVVKKVYLIDRHDALAATPILVDRVHAKANIEIRLQQTVFQIKGDKTVEAIAIRGENTYELPVKAVFPFVGSIPNTSFIADKDVLDKNGYIIADQDMKTSVPGLFAAGDVIAKTLRQIVTAASDGAIAAGSASKYLRKKA
jgi:thioredoxin reductase (NADPH)